MSLHAFIAECQAMKGGAERANYGLFIERFCKALDLPTPNYGAGGVLGDYQLDAPLKGGSLKSDATGYIDCYRKHHFILEAKQSRTAEGKKTPQQPAEIIARLVRLNADRAAEEKAGTIRYLRPDYQNPPA